MKGGMTRLSEKEINSIYGGSCDCVVNEKIDKGRASLDFLQEAGYFVGGIANMYFGGFAIGIAAGLIFSGVILAMKTAPTPEYDCSCRIVTN